MEVVSRWESVSMSWELLGIMCREHVELEHYSELPIG